MTSLPLPSAVTKELARLGAGIKTARIRRSITQEDLADRIGISWHTLRKIEQGSPTTGIAYYFHALWVLGIFDDVSIVADPTRDQEGLILEASQRGTRASSTRKLSRDF